VAVLEERQQFLLNGQTAPMITPLAQKTAAQDQRVDVALDGQGAFQQSPLITDGQGEEE
jgi:hypothetical protein